MGDGWFFIVSGFFLGWAGVCDVIDLRADFLRNIWACDNGRRTDRNWKGKYPKTAAAVLPFLLPASLWMVLMRMI